MFKTFNNDQLDETIYQTVLDNGLTVVIVEKPLFKSSFACFGTKFGALHLNQEVNGHNYLFNAGLAHFLEHKLFEDETKDIAQQFSNLNCHCNAYTSLDKTIYYFSCVNQTLDRPLNLLLDFVQNLTLSQESVEKEKDIIIQEVLMYQNNPTSRLFMESLKALYQNHYIKNDVGGSVKDVEAITKEELELAHQLNYHPKNMVLVVVSNQSYQTVLDIVVKNQSTKKYSNDIALKNIVPVEPNEVAKKEVVIEMPINSIKNCFALKINQRFDNVYDSFKASISLNFLLTSLYTSLNPNYQKWLDEKIINDFFGFDIDITPEYAYILFYKEHGSVYDFKTFIKHNFDLSLISEKLLLQIKRRYLFYIMNNFDNIDNYGLEVASYTMMGLEYFEILNIINNISLDDIKESSKYLDMDNCSLISIVPRKD